MTAAPELVALLEEHSESYDSDCATHDGCSCGWAFPAEESYFAAHEAYNVHLAGVVAAHFGVPDVPPAPENAEPTPEQWVARFLTHHHTERVKIAENVLRFSREANLCFILNHVDRLAGAEAQLRAFVLEREKIAKTVEALAVDINGPGGWTEGIRDAAAAVRHLPKVPDAEDA